MNYLLNSIEWKPKLWGGEQILVNDDQYCGKILHFVKDHRASFHYHRLKKESFYVLEGKILLLFSPNYEHLEKNKDDVRRVLEYAEFRNLTKDELIKIYDMKYCISYEILDVGEIFHIDRCMVHQAIALLDSKIIEFSTHSEDSDSYRIVSGA